MRLKDCLFLLDVDGTLLATGGPYHGPALEDAVRDVCGVEPDATALVLAGRTDSEILLEMMRTAGAADPERQLDRAIARAVAHFRSHLPMDLRKQVLPGVVDALELFRQEGAELGLVTGNIAEIAWTKMECSGLGRYFAFGAFGDESSVRADLPLLAAKRAGRAFAPENSYVIGDTPRDIDCGRACRMKTVAVATGRYTSAELEPYHPTCLCANLREFAERMLREQGRVCPGLPGY
ncbi:MAG: haloacid dehalogenase-like hydrolase [Chloroflexota bacterium]|nr:haloacid dehalogenase-like hydrolase [Chloroflexota bacterium]